MQYITENLTGIDGTTARLTGYVPDNSPEVDMDRIRPTILIIPGGGYEMTSDREAEPIAFQFLAKDVNAFVLRYSCRPSVYPTALLEVADAVTLIREHAREWNVDTDRISVMGFSAGAHLAADFATSASDEILSAHGYNPEELRPRGLLLAYPVITSGEFRHDGSFRALLGERYGNTDAMHEVSIEEHIDGTTPPVFLWHTITDDVVPVENSLALIEACKRAQVPVEAHIFPEGGHGLALANEQTAWNGTDGIVKSAQNWITLALDWFARLNNRNTND